MRIPMRFCVLSAVVLALNAGGLFWIRQEVVRSHDPATRPLRVVSAVPKQDVDTADRLSLIFDEPVARAEQIGEPLSKSPFEIEPEPLGHWTWVEPRRLDFVLDKPLPAGSEFKIVPVPDIDLQMGRVVQVDGKLEFTTRPLKLEASQLLSFDPNNANIELKFNQKVDPATLLKYIQICDVAPGDEEDPQVVAAADPKTIKTDDDKAKREQKSQRQVTCLTKEPSEKLVIRAQRHHRTQWRNKQIKLVLDGALAGHEGQSVLGATQRRVFEFKSLFVLLRAEALQPSLDEAVCVNLFFTRPLDRTQNAPPVELTPKVENLTVSIVQSGGDEANIVRIEGPLEPGKRYSVSVGPTLLAEKGDTLGTKQTASFDVPERYPSVRFTNSQGILMPQGNLMLDVQTVNVAGLELSTSRIHKNNLVAHLRGESTRRLSRSLKTRTIVLNASPNQPSTRALDIRELIDEPTGLYAINADATNHTWTSDSALINITDMALTLKKQRAGQMVWVTSLKTGHPLADVKITALSENNQTLATAISDANGLATLSVNSRHPDGEPWVIVAERGNDLTYLQSDRRQWVLDEVDQAGRSTPETYDVLLYTERGVYRPGDTIHLTGIIRDAAGAIPATFPVAINVTRPDGRQVATLTALAESPGQGVFHVDYPTREDGQTGPYRFVATLPGSKDTLGNTQTLVEAFVPVRIDMQAAATQERFGPEDKIGVAVSARYLFGQPAGELPVTIAGAWQRVTLSPSLPESTGFTFGGPNRSGAKPLVESKFTLDAEGKLTADLAAPTGEKPGLWRGAFNATVTEPGGRSISKFVAVNLDTAGRHVGLRIPVGRVVPVKAPVAVDWIQRTATDGPAVPGPLDVTLHRVEYDTVLKKVRGEMVWRSVEHLTSVWTGAVLPEGAQLASGKIEITCPTAGTYRLLAIDRLSKCETELEIYAASGAAEALNVGISQPEKLEVVLDHDSYVPGNMARVLVKSPFAGTMLLSVETDRVLESRVIAMPENSISVDLLVPADLRGGAFVTASVVRAVDPNDSKWLPHRAMGMARLVTNHSAHALPVTIHAPTSVRPGDTIHVEIETAVPADPQRPTAVHVWAVDEGILLTTAYKTPTPHKHFLGARRLDVTTSDVFAELLPDYKRPLSIARIGGDRDEAEAQRRNPVATKRAAPVVVWRSFGMTDATGKLALDLELPKFTGGLRLMAVAIDGDRYGSTQQTATVSAPLLVEASWPRFAAPQDKFQVPVKLFNTTAQPLVVSFGAKIEGPLEVDLPFEQRVVTVYPDRPTTLWLNAHATTIGPVSVALTAGAMTVAEGDLTTTIEATLPVRPAMPLHSVVQFFSTDAGTPLTIEPPKEFHAAGMRHMLSISATPDVELRPALEQLVDYPYGCVEQTSSRLAALLAAKKIIALTTGPDGRPQALGEMVDAGIARLWSMQTRSGGLSYWPGDVTPNLWGTAYAASVLMDAKQDGHVIDERFIQEVSQFLAGALTREKDANGDELDENQKAQICHVLAAFKQAPEGWLSRLSEQLDKLDMQGRADLAAAWHLAGRKDRALGALPDNTITQSVLVSSSGRLTSQVRQEAALLKVLLEIDREHGWIPILVARLYAARKDGAWGNTLENATALSALARYQALKPAPAEFEGTVHVGTQGPFAFDHKKAAVLPFTGLTQSLDVASRGKGKIHVTLSTTGLLKEGADVAYDRGIQVRRLWTDRAGNTVDPSTLKVGDFVNVEVRLKTLPRSDDVENVAIVDALPAGVEVENQRLASSATSEGSQTGSDPDRVEFLDDRVVLFCTARSSEQKFRYALRVISIGEFTLPAIQASGMYDAGQASVHGAGRVVVSP